MFHNAHGCASQSPHDAMHFKLFYIDRINISDLQNIKIFILSVCITSYLSNESKIMLIGWA